MTTTFNTRRLPLGIQDFAKLRTEKLVYIDKTGFIPELTATSSPYFLSRPRRFGKSLLLSTLKYYFEGRKDLFEGLAIADVEKDWTKYPVFHLDFNAASYADMDSFNAIVDRNLRYIEEIWGRDEAEKDFSDRFAGVIKRAYKQSEKGVVILVDEYDKPLLNTRTKPDLHKEIKDVLKGFYGVLKSTDQYLRFILFTGVSKFSKVSVFSDLNNLTDISLENNFSAICGITEKELLTQFEPEIKALGEAQNLTYDQTVAKLKKMYDGYHFSEISEDVYNPWSLLNSFYKKRFTYEWFKSGTPTMLVEMLKDTDYDLPKLEKNVVIPAQEIDDFRMDSPYPIPLLYQTGYLTIKDFITRVNSYKMGFPNEEVKYGFINELLPIYISKSKGWSSSWIAAMVQDLYNEDLEDLMLQLTSFFADIPYVLENKTEKHFQTIFYLVFTLVGQLVKVEKYSSAGRADAVMEVEDKVYIFEFKLTDNATAEEALQQIEESGYATPYLASGKKIIKIGIAFDNKTRTIGEWKSIVNC
ncbi:MAG: ATP-binding protein [Bacteroidales bacterium]|jgi:hypothetical protein|nr:ATP-binding protein [Bacteroidales bacterium]